MGLVKGFTDVLCPPNLVTNGSFTVNQRGLFTAFSPIKQGDFPVDAWFLGTCTLDTCEAKTNVIQWFSGIAEIGFRGYGKKGQYLYLGSRDPFIMSTSLPFSSKITAKYTIRASTASVPVTARLKCPSAVTENVFNNWATLKPGTTRDIVTVGSNGIANSGAYLMTPWVTLEADGYFEFYLSRAMALSGEFSNPPNFIGTSYADDLLRCKRYYQRGTVELTALGSLRGASGGRQLGFRHSLSVEMAGTPSLVIPAFTVEEEGSSVDVSANYSLISHANSHSIWLGVQKASGVVPCYFSAHWEATV